MNEFELKIAIEQKQNRINSGVITNLKTLKQAKKDINRWKNKLKQLNNKQK